jgi:DNA uptake protein ComE-like DNA-binding protein
VSKHDLNEATADEQMEVPTFSVRRVHYLIETRKKLGRFKNWEDVKQTPGFSDGMIRRLQEAGFSIVGCSKAA